MECISFCGGQSFFPSKAGNRQCAASLLFRRTRTRDSNRPLRLKASDPVDGPPSARPIRLAVHGGKAGGRSGNARASRAEARANVTRTGAKLKNLRFSDAGDVTDETLHEVGPSAALPRADPGVRRRQIHRFEARRPVPGCSGRRACHRRRERRCPSRAVKSRAIKKGGNALFRSLIRSAPASQSAPVSSSFFGGAQSRYHGAMQMTQGRYARMARRLPT